MHDSDKIQIAVCDDQEMIAKQLAGMIREIMARKKIPFALSVFLSGKELVEQVSDFDVAFLDIDMPELDGIETGKRILQRNRDCRIIVASGREDRFKETYQIETLRFVSKPFDQKEIAEAIEAFLNQRIGMEQMEMYKDRISFKIRWREIWYITAYNNYVEIVADGVVYRKDISLGALEKILDGSCFFRIHRKYIINLLWVTGCRKGYVQIGGAKLPVSRRKQKEFEMAYIDFDIKYR